MENYIGVKRVKAMYMDREVYNSYRGWELPADENGADEGYLVEYVQSTDSPNKNHPNHEGYISWSPKDVFEEAYRKTEGLTFGEAIEAAKKGIRVARIGWNGAGMYVYIHEATSLPSENDEQREEFGEVVNCRAFWIIKTAQKDLSSWAPSGSDSLAEDWMIVE